MLLSGDFIALRTYGGYPVVFWLGRDSVALEISNRSWRDAVVYLTKALLESLRSSVPVEGRPTMGVWLVAVIFPETLIPWPSGVRRA